MACFQESFRCPGIILLRKSHHLRSEESPGKASNEDLGKKTNRTHSQNITVRSEHMPTLKSAQQIKITGWAHIIRQFNIRETVLPGAIVPDSPCRNASSPQVDEPFPHSRRKQLFARMISQHSGC